MPTASTRNALVRWLVGKGIPLEGAFSLIAAHDHELAESIRDGIEENVRSHGPSSSDEGAQWAADLIDPEVP